MVAEDAGTRADGSAGGDDVIDEADRGTAQGWTGADEGVREGALALGGVAANLAAGVAHAPEGDWGAGEVEGGEQQLGLVESALALTGGVEWDGYPGLDREGRGEGAELAGEERDEGAVALVLQAVHECPGGPFVLVDGADASEITEVEAARAEALARPGGAAARATPGSLRGEEP